MKYLYEVTVTYMDGGLTPEIVHIVECGSARRAAVLGRKVALREYRRRGGTGRLPKIEKIEETGSVDARD